MSEPCLTTPLGAFAARFDRIFCVSLPRSSDRRSYITDYFREIGIKEYEFFDATDHTDAIVAEYYKQGLVATYPPCFRCHRLSCGSDTCNNVLIPPQVATFITYLSLWKEIIRSNTDKALILEDDVRFTDHAGHIVTAMEDALIKEKFRSENPVLLRFGWAWCAEHQQPGHPGFIKDAVRMSNPCHAITHAFARRLVSSFTRIDTTVDIYQHQQIGSTVENYTLLPPPAYELSWSTGALESLIHPKQARLHFLKEHHPDRTTQMQSTARAIQAHFSHIMYRPLLLVGHPCCGSEYMSWLSGTLGLDIGNEKRGKHGICSWMLAVHDDTPLATVDKYAACRKLTYFSHRIHYVRNPRDAIPDIVHDNNLNPEALEYRRRHIRNTFGIDIEDCATGLERAALSYVYWNRIIELDGTEATVRIEDQQEKLAGLFFEYGLLAQRPVPGWQIPAEIEKNRQSPNMQTGHESISEESWLNIRKDILEALNIQCGKYGYEKVTAESTSSC